jgi:hypothetical protein
VFCHGGVEDLSGAPPKNLDGTLTVAESMFAPHCDHINTAMTEPFDCVECHVKATDVLSQGHVFDDTPGMAEADLGGGLSPQGTYASGDGCQSLYCHGNGQGDNGAIATDAPAMSCDSCHAGLSSGAAGWSEMGGLHSFHLGSGARCEDCHQATTSNGTSIADPDLHVDGAHQIRFTDLSISYNSATGRCSGDCHGKNHENKSW